MKILVCGSRTYTDKAKVDSVLDEVLSGHPEPLLIIHGAAQGADTLADAWALAHAHQRVHIAACPPDYDRGQFMLFVLDFFHPDLVVAFVDKPVVDSRGTHDMLKRARKAGVLIRVYGLEATDA